MRLTDEQNRPATGPAVSGTRTSDNSDCLSEEQRNWHALERARIASHCFERMAMHALVPIRLSIQLNYAVSRRRLDNFHRPEPNATTIVFAFH